MLVAVYWVADGVRGPVGSVTTPLLPAFVSASSSSGGQYRTLSCGPAARRSTYTLVRQSDPTLGEPELTAASAAAAALTGRSPPWARRRADAGDPGLVLGDFGIKWVMLPGPVNQALAQRLDASVGLVPVSKAPAYDLWQVSGPVARVRVVAKDGTVTPLAAQPVGMTAVTAPAAGGTLVLAEPYGGWTAMLGGTALKPLPAPVNGWAQGFTLPAGGGQLVITRNDLARNVSLIAELVAVLAICVLALPGKRADPAEEAAALAALRDAQHGRRAARAARESRLPGLPGLPGRAGLSRLSGRLEQSGREAARTGRAAAAGLGAFRGRATAQDTDPADLVTTGSGVGVLDDPDADEPDYTEERDQARPARPVGDGPAASRALGDGPALRGRRRPARSRLPRGRPARTRGRRRPARSRLPRGRPARTRGRRRPARSRLPRGRPARTRGRRRPARSRPPRGKRARTRGAADRPAARDRAVGPRRRGPAARRCRGTWLGRDRRLG